MQTRHSSTATACYLFQNLIQYFRYTSKKWPANKIIAFVQAQHSSGRGNNRMQSDAFWEYFCSAKCHQNQMSKLYGAGITPHILGVAKGSLIESVKVNRLFSPWIGTFDCKAMDGHRKQFTLHVIVNLDPILSNQYWQYQYQTVTIKNIKKYKLCLSLQVLGQAVPPRKKSGPKKFCKNIWGTKSGTGKLATTATMWTWRCITRPSIWAAINYTTVVFQSRQLRGVTTT